MSHKYLLLSREERGVLIVTVSRPKELNALNREVLDELGAVFEKEALETDVRVVIVTGAGPKSFVAGADISEMVDNDAMAAREFSLLGHSVLERIERLPKPVIAAVNGFALGGGMELALACDFIVASDNAVFGQPEVLLGIIPGWGGNIRLAQAVGVPYAKELIFSGRKIKADEALRVGLVSKVVPSDKLMPEVLELARLISANSASAVAAAKGVIQECTEQVDIEARRECEATAFGRLFGSGDQREGMKAFLERRTPNFP